MRYPRLLLPIGVVTVATTLLMACGGDDGGSSTGAVATATSTGSSSESEAAATGGTGASAATGSAGTTGATGGEGASELDVCSLISKAEVDGILRQAAGDPVFNSMGDAGAAAGLTGGDCRFEATGVTPVVSISVLAWRNEDDAESSFSAFTATEEIDGLGDQAVNTQPVGDVSVLLGRYEISVDLYFVDEDDSVELGMAREIAEIVVSRLPD